MAARALSSALLGLGCALAGAVLGWQLRGHWPQAPEAPAAESAPAAEAPASSAPVYGLELLPEVLAVQLRGPWGGEAWGGPRSASLLEDVGPLRDWHEGFRALDARVGRPAPLGPALAEAFLHAPELFLTEYPSRFDVPALDLYGPRPASPSQKGRPMAASPSRNEAGSSSARRRLVALCAGLTLSGCATKQVGQLYDEYLRDCPPEARAAQARLELDTRRFWVITMDASHMRVVESTIVMREGPVSGPLTGNYDAEQPHLRDAVLHGRLELHGDRFAAYFDKIVLKDGTALPICGIGTLMGAMSPGLQEFPHSHYPWIDQSFKERLPALRAGLRRGELPLGMPDVMVAFRPIPAGTRWF